jgi:cytochrome oxidase assembly protein ShyY1
LIHRAISGQIKEKRERGFVAPLRKTIIVNTTLVAIMLTLGLGLWQGQGRLMKEIRGIEAQAQRMTSSNPANAVSSCSALVAVFFAWRSFTGYRRRVEN